MYLLWLKVLTISLNEGRFVGESAQVVCIIANLKNEMKYSKINVMLIIISIPSQPSCEKGAAPKMKKKL